MEFLARPEVQDLLIKFLITVVSVVISGIGYLSAKWTKANISREQMELAETIAGISVDAVEQLAAAGIIDYKKKMEHAIVRARGQAEKWGITFTDTQWETLLEATVKSMKDAGTEIIGSTREFDNVLFDDPNDP